MGEDYTKKSLQILFDEGKINNENIENIENIEIKLKVIYKNKFSKTYLLTYKKNWMFEVTSIQENFIGKTKKIVISNNHLQPILFQHIIETEINEGKQETEHLKIEKIIHLSTTVNMKEEQEELEGGKLKKGQKKKTSKKPVVSQNKENKYKEVLGKRMKIYKKPDSRKEFVRYKGELVPLVEYKNLIKHKK